MTIAEIKSGLSILTVLSHYGLSVNRNGMVCCPFHDDKKASMKVYRETDTVYCFAGSCEVNNLDAIDFIMKMDGSTKHEALLKARSLLTAGRHVITTSISSSQAKVSFPAKTTQSDPSKEFARYLKSFVGHREAQVYCAGRGLNPQLLEIGYKSRRTKSRWGKGCIIFGLKNEAGEVVSLYGRSIYGDGHYYQSNRRGLYPGYPDGQTRELLLTESVIDAASVEQLGLGVSVLALYGTNGLTVEHKEALSGLKSLERVVLLLDGDEAGRVASAMYAELLSKLLPGVQVDQVELAEGEDVNSILVSRSDAPEYFAKLLGGKLVEKPVDKSTKNKEIIHPVLDTKNANNLSYRTSHAQYYIKGGIRSGQGDYDHMKVSLVVENEVGRKSRQKLDLYEDKHIEKVSRLVADKLGLRPDLLELDLQELTDELERYREQKGSEKKEEKIEVPLVQRSSCLDFLRKPNLIRKVNELIGRAGLIGEQSNRLLLYVVASSYKMPDTLHALIQGASGSGKTRLLRVISELMPTESVKRYTRVTDGSFYNQGEYYFTHKLLCFEDIDGLKEDALLAVRELQSSEILITSTSIKDEHGRISGGERIVRGPIASLACTTRAEVYEDNISRCFVVAVDESQAQSLRIIQYQNDEAAGLIDGKEEQQARVFLQNCMRLLEPLGVINPYANKIHLPQEAHKIRRLNELYQSFVKQLTLLHQYQRKRDNQGRLISEKEDLQLACDILFESIVLKVDELDGSLRQFFEQLKEYVKSKGEKYEFSRREVRLKLRISKTQMLRYMHTLLEMEYVQQRGHANRGYVYRISFWDDNEGLRKRLKEQINQQLKDL